jgi:signal transduction histidine kinase/CheY-like chemotaxis protein
MSPSGEASWEADPNLRPQVLRARVRLLFDQMPVALISSLAIIGCLVALLWREGAHTALLVWLGVQVVLVAARLLLAWHFKRQDYATLDARRWAWVYTASSAISGVVLGLGGLIFYRHDLFSIVAMGMVFGVMSLGSIVLHAAFIPSHLGYVVPLLLPLGLRCVSTGEAGYLVVGGVVLGLIPVSTRLTKQMSQGLIESIDLRARNQELVLELQAKNEIAQAAQAAAERANLAKTRFFAAASHDLRQPVQAVELFAATLAQEAHLPQSQRLVGNIQLGVRELSGLLNALLDYVKIDSATLHPVPESVSMNQVLRHMAIEFRAQAQNKGLELRVVPCSAWVHSDPVLLERMVRNLMHNALRYTPKGRILVGCRRCGGRLRLEVHDTGVGIPPEKQRVVFQEFVQLDNPERDRHKGLGLGLAIVSGLARLLDSQVSLRSTPGVGSVFAITLPSAQAPQTLPEPAPLVSAVPNQEGGTLLVIDDDAEIRESLRGLLGNWGYAVQAVESADLAQNLMDHTGFEPDALLVDYRLRAGRTGLDAIAEVRAALGFDIPALMITGDTAPAIQQHIAQQGLKVLYKPVSAPDLRAELLRLMHHTTLVTPALA